MKDSLLPSIHGLGLDRTDLAQPTVSDVTAKVYLTHLCPQSSKKHRNIMKAAPLPERRLAEGHGRGWEVQSFMRTQTMHLVHPKLMLNWPDVHLRVGRHSESYSRTPSRVEGELIGRSFLWRGSVLTRLR